MTRLVLVRHGETVWHAENRYAGSTDVALTERGLAQADHLAAWAARAGLQRIVSSPLSRARRTAEPCARRTGLEVTVDPRLRELDFGDGEGLRASEMDARFPDARAAFRADPVAHHLPGGEDPRDAATRFVEALSDLARELPDGRALVVAHSTAIRLALCRLLGLDLSAYRRTFPALGNCSLTELEVDADTGAGPDDAVRRAALLRLNVPTDPAALPGQGR